MQRIDVPYTPDWYALASRRSQVTRVLVLALALRTLALIRLPLLKDNPAEEAHRVFNELTLIAWGAIWVTLIVASDYETTTDLALAFALLVFVAVLLHDGPQAFKVVSGLVNLDAVPVIHSPDHPEHPTPPPQFHTN